nr:hypothetical protein [Tanacetum cinerariifolium]
MDILAEHAARKAAKLELQSSFKSSPVAGDATKRPFNSKRNKKPLHSKHASLLAKLSPPPRNLILRSAKHAPPLANPKPKTPNLKPSDVIESDEEEGDGSGSEEEGDEEEDEEEGDEEEDEKDGDEFEDKEEVDKQDDEEKCDEEEDDEEEGDEEEDEKDGDEFEDKEVGEKKRKKDSEPSSSEDEKPLTKKTKGKGKGPSKTTLEKPLKKKKVVSDNQIRREKFLSDYPPLLSRTIPSFFFHVIRDAKVNMKSFMEDIRFSALHSVNIDTLPNRLARFVVRAFDSKTYNFYLKIGVIHVTAEKHWLNQFALKKKKRIFATDIAEKLVRSTRVDFMFKVNFLMLFANVMGKADTMRAFVNLSVVRRIREDTNIAGLDWCDFIHYCLAISHEPNTVSGFYNGPLCFLIYLEIEDEAFGKLEIYGEWSENETIICEMIEEKLSRISKEKAEVETLLRDANKEFPNDDNEASVKTKPAAVKAKEAAEKPKLVENIKELAEKPKEPSEKAHEAPQKVKPKPADVKTKEGAKKLKPTENVKEVAENPKEPAEKAQEAPQYELAEKPKELAGDDYQVVPAATVMKAEDRKEFEVETFTQWIEGNIDWVGEDELHDWPRVVEPINMVQPSTPKRVFSSPSKGYVKPVKTVNTPYICRRIDVTARCKRIKFVLGNSLFAMEGDKYETVFQSLGGYRELSSVRVNMETLAPTLCIDANVIDCWVALLNFEELALVYPTPTRHFFPTGCIIKGTLTEEEQWKSFYDEFKTQFKYEPSSMSLSDFELVFFSIYASDHFYVVVFNIKKPKTMVILDNSDSGYRYASKYKEACDPLKKLFSRYLKKQNHSSHEAVAKMRPFIPKLKWQTSNNHVDCGVFAMIHMENYVGDTAKNWEFGLCKESDEQLSIL